MKRIKNTLAFIYGVLLPPAVILTLWWLAHDAGKWRP